MDNTAMKIIDDALRECMPESLALDDGFYLKDDAKAEWAILKLQQENAELNRIELICSNMKSYYDNVLKQAREKHERKTEFLEQQLERYFTYLQDNKLVKSTKTTDSYQLPSATLKLKQQSPELERDEDKLLAWCKENGAEFIKVKESVNWADLKKNLTIKDGKAITKDGEILESIRVYERRPKFEVEF